MNGKTNKSAQLHEHPSSFSKATLTVRDTARCEKAEEAVKASEMRFTELFNKMNNGVAIYDAVDGGNDFVFKDMNSAGQRIERIDKKDIVGKKVTEAFPGVKELGLLDVLRRVWKTGNPERCPMSFYKDSRIQGWRDNYVYKLPSGEIVAIYEDITERMKAEGALRESEEKFAKVFQSSPDAFMLTTVPDGRISEVNDNVLHISGYTRDELIGRTTDELGMWAKPDDRDRYIAAIRRDGRALEFETVFRIKSGKTFPGIISGQIVKLRGGAHFLSIIRDISERKKAEEALQESESKYRSLVEQTGVGIGTVDEHGVFTFVNDALCAMGGYSKEELLGKEFIEFISPEDAERILNLFMERLEKPGKRVSLEFGIRCKDGNIRTCITSPMAIVKDGKVAGFRIVIIDITERKKAENAVRASEQKYSNLFDNQYDVIFVADTETGRIVDTNKQGEILLGRPKSEIIGMHQIELHPKDKAEHYGKQFTEHMKAGRTAELNSEIVRKDGTVVPVSICVSQIESHGKKLLMGVFRDMTELRKMDAELKKERDFNMNLVEESPAFVIALDEKCNTLLMNDTALKTLGYSFEQAIGMHFAQSFVHSDDREAMLKLLDKAKHQKGVAVGESRLVSKIGGAVFIEFRVKPMFKKTGEFDYYLGLAIDVSERKKAEEAKLASELRYRRLFESAKDGILILDAETGMIVDVNPFLINILGFSREQFLGKTVWELGIFKDIAANRANFLELQKKEYVRYEDMPLETADGRRMDVEFVSNVYLVDHKKVVQCNIRDITERKKAEKSKELAAHVLERLNVGNEKERIIGDIVQFVKEYAGVDATAIRLKDGDDYPYYTTNGFPDHFVEAERNLCLRDEKGVAVRDSAGNPILECMCGNIISGRTNPDKPFFTKGGSFWTNGTTKLLASTTETDRQARARNRCNGEGYESVALMPLRAGKKSETIGLLQLNDKRENMFTLAQIEFLEGLGNSIGIAIARKQAEDSVRQSEEKYKTLVESATDLIFMVGKNHRVLSLNIATANALGEKPEGAVGKHIHELFPKNIADGYAFSIDEVFKTGKKQLRESKMVARGRESILDVSLSPVKDKTGNTVAVLGISRDITEQKKAEKERAEHLKEHARGEIHGFLISSLPVFTANVPPEVRNGLIHTFADKFEQNFRPVLVRALAPVLPAAASGGGAKGEPDWNKIIGTYLAWSSELLSNLGIDAKTEVGGAKTEGVTGRIEFTNCPWIKDARDNPVFCMICKTMVIRSFAWLSDNGSANNTSTIANGADRCAFEMRVAENQ